MRVADNGGEYGRMAIRTTQASTLYSYEETHSQQVWMSHGDEVTRLPDGFQAVATSDQVSSACGHALRLDSASLLSANLLSIVW